MDPNEWCAIVHIDIGSQTGLVETERLLRELVADAGSTDGTISLGALRLQGRPNHFELIGRYGSEVAYLNHLVAPTNLALRSGIAEVLGSPYEDRLHGPRGAQTWPQAGEGDFVVISQAEARPAELDAALSALDELAAARLSAPGLSGQAVLQRRHRPNNVELVSVWSGAEAFEECLAAESAGASRHAVEQLLLAPLDDRRYEFLAGSW